MLIIIIIIISTVTTKSAILFPGCRASPDLPDLLRTKLSFGFDHVLEVCLDDFLELTPLLTSCSLLYITFTAYVLLKFVHKCTASYKHKDSVERSYFIYLQQLVVCSHGVRDKEECLGDRKREIQKSSFCNMQPFPEKNR